MCNDRNNHCPIIMSIRIRSHQTVSTWRKERTSRPLSSLCKFPGWLDRWEPSPLPLTLPGCCQRRSKALFCSPRSVCKTRQRSFGCQNWVDQCWQCRDLPFLHTENHDWDTPESRWECSKTDLHLFSTKWKYKDVQCCYNYTIQLIIILLIGRWVGALIT